MHNMHYTIADAFMESPVYPPTRAPRLGGPAVCKRQTFMLRHSGQRIQTHRKNIDDVM